MVFVERFLSNERNTKKIIGLRTERSLIGKQYRTALLQLCDGDYCQIVQLSSDVNPELLEDLFNFLNLPDFTFMGTGINKALKDLDYEFGLTCNNAVEIGPSSWHLFNETEAKCRMVRQFTSKPITSVVCGGGGYFLSQEKIKLATKNAYFAFKIGNLFMAMY